MYNEELDAEIMRLHPQWSILMRQYFAQMRKTKPTLYFVENKEYSPERFIRKVLTMADWSIKSDDNVEVLKPTYFGFYDSAIIGRAK